MGITWNESPRREDQRNEAPTRAAARAAASATTPVVMMGLPPAPFVDEPVAVADGVDGVVVIDVPPVARGTLAVLVPPIGAVDCPLISAWTDLLNDPDMLVIL